MGTTTNYSWNTPTVGGDEDTWGDELVTLAQDIDTQVKAVSDSIAPAVASGSSVKLITSNTFSASAAPGAALSASYNAHRVVFHGLIPSGNPTLTLQLSFDNGANWKSGASDYAYNIISVTNLSGVNRSSGATAFQATQNTMDTTASKANAITVELYGPKASGFGTAIRTDATYWSSSNIEWDTSNGQIVPGYGAPTNVRLVCSTGTMTGAYAVYGMTGF